MQCLLGIAAILVTLAVLGCTHVGATSTSHPLYERVCGSPAEDGYAHVDPTCLHNSPTAKWHADFIASGGKGEDLDVHAELAAEYDGVAGNSNSSQRGSGTPVCPT